MDTLLCFFQDEKLKLKDDMLKIRLAEQKTAITKKYEERVRRAPHHTTASPPQPPPPPQPAFTATVPSAIANLPARPAAILLLSFASAGALADAPTQLTLVSQIEQMKNKAKSKADKQKTTKGKVRSQLGGAPADEPI